MSADWKSDDRKLEVAVCLRALGKLSPWSAPRSPTHPLLRGGPRNAPVE